jgi:hypothetical protein
VIPIGAALYVDTVDPALGDERKMAWATTDQQAALRWAYQRYRQRGETLFVYEVELYAPVVDSNVHRGAGPEQRVHSVMAPSGRVVALTLAVPETEYDEGARRDAADK